jgi:hypothetical protein
VATSQDIDSTSILNGRQKSLKIAIPLSYAAGSFALYQAWYKDYPKESFHFFNDLKEWEGVDKAGHIYSSYIQTDLLTSVFSWAGYERKTAVRNASLLSFAYQSTIEIMDGFSSAWGFSIADIGSNLIGNALYIAQEQLWGQQKIQMKMSSFPINYSNDIILSETSLFSSSLNDRAKHLYGNSWPESFLKDYNAQTIWFSSNPADWLSSNKWPNFLALSLGYGANNMFGGFENNWELNDENFIIDPVSYPRYKQYVLALDYDLRKIRSKKAWVNTILKALNLFKWPAPAIEYRSNGEWVFHLLFLN